MTLLLLAVLAAEPMSARIDARLKQAWAKHKITPAAPATDAEFLRRATLDLVGTIPTRAELEAHLASPDRKKAVARLLADPRFAAHQAQVWDQVLFGRDAPYELRDRTAFRAWLAGKFAKGAGLDAIAASLLKADEEGSEAFLAQFRSRSEDAAERVSRVFLGTQLQCARCHDHPFDPSLTQRDFFGMAGFLIRVVVHDPSGKDKRWRIGEKSTGEVLFDGSAKEARPGRKGVPIRPKFLGGKELDEPAVPKGFKEPKAGRDMPAPLFSRKAKLAEWVASAGNPFFARAMANRVWGQLMGRGLVHPVDDFSIKNEPSLPALLDDLAKGLIERKFDLRGLMGEIVLSDAYALSHKGASTEALPRWHERAKVRPLSAEELLASMRTATGFDAAGGKITGAIAEYMRMYMGKPTNGIGDFQAGLMEHLFVNNSGEVRDLARRRKGGLADELLTMKEEWPKRVDRLFLSVLSRLPSEKERARFVAYLTSEPKADALVEEAIWVLLASAEFRFQH
ncbi:MAG: DUF1549 and DUF1553 domain-containing protein [Gemmataceae bacterium]|nr:DUF1549 and DUF1553 domain-containing protein [Gemmataceae bacterium]